MEATKMDNVLQTYLRELQQKPASSRSYSESLTIATLEDLENVSGEEMQRRIMGLSIKLEKHANAIGLKEQKEYIKEHIGVLQSLEARGKKHANAVGLKEQKEYIEEHIDTRSSGDEWEEIEKS
ncbi:uncharacterized protein BDV17DRAFT_116500 [Aspergillus undulatus]|uniref:uncharacterized protein n=1 Tax=Aspergillus undulatus TaxID=1810928 RepID=UPI003CCD6C36